MQSRMTLVGHQHLNTRPSSRYFFARGFFRSSIALFLVLAGLAGAAATGYAWRERETRLEAASLAHVRALSDRLEIERDTLRASNQTLGARGRALAAELELERAGRLEAVATLKDVQTQLSGVREQLSFYQTLVPDGDALDMTVQEFRVARGGAGQTFILVLTRTSGREVASEGIAYLSATGEQQGKRVVLGHQALTGGRNSGMPFAMQHFARLEGPLRLPEGFVPARITLDIQVTGDNAGRMQRVFDWSRVAS